MYLITEDEVEVLCCTSIDAALSEPGTETHTSALDKRMETKGKIFSRSFEKQISEDELHALKEAVNFVFNHWPRDSPDLTILDNFYHRMKAQHELKQMTSNQINYVHGICPWCGCKTIRHRSHEAANDVQTCTNCNWTDDNLEWLESLGN